LPGSGERRSRRSSPRHQHRFGRNRPERGRRSGPGHQRAQCLARSRLSVTRAIAAGAAGRQRPGSFPPGLVGPGDPAVARLWPDRWRAKSPHRVAGGPPSGRWQRHGQIFARFLRSVRSFLLNTPGAILLVSVAALDPAAATAQVPVETRSNVVLPPDRDAAEINPAGREVTLTASVMDGSVYLGDATASLGIDGMVTFSAERLLTLLEPRLRSEILENLRAALARNLTLRQADLQANGVGVRYDPQTLQIELAIAPASRAANVVGLSDESGRVVSYAAPADVSAYLNVRGAMDWVQQGDDQGLNAPVMFLDGAARIKGLVLDTEPNWQPGAAGVDFQRRGPRLVYDDRDQL